MNDYFWQSAQRAAQEVAIVGLTNMQFASYEDYDDYFGHYLKGFVDSGADQTGILE